MRETERTSWYKDRVWGARCQRYCVILSLSFITHKTKIEWCNNADCDAAKDKALAHPAIASQWVHSADSTVEWALNDYYLWLE